MHNKETLKYPLKFQLKTWSVYTLRLIKLLSRIPCTNSFSHSYYYKKCLSLSLYLNNYCIGIISHVLSKICVVPVRKPPRPYSIINNLSIHHHVGALVHADVCVAQQSPGVLWEMSVYWKFFVKVSRNVTNKWLMIKTLKWKHPYLQRFSSESHWEMSGHATISGIL